MKTLAEKILQEQLDDRITNGLVRKLDALVNNNLKIAIEELQELTQEKNCEGCQYERNIYIKLTYVMHA